MKSSWLIVAITWTILIQSFALIANGAIALDLVNPTKAKYSTFLTSIRNDVKDPKLNYGGTGIPVIGAPTNTYLRIDLQVLGGKVSLGLNRSDLYVIAFLTTDKTNKARAYFLNDKITTAQLDELFPEAPGAANQQRVTEYGESYDSLETIARVSRQQLGFGIKMLTTYSQKVNGVARNVQNEAKFLLIAIQMVSEAARFGTIENAVLGNFQSEQITPSDEVITLQLNWSRISGAIKASSKGVFKPSLVLTPTWTVIYVDDLYMRLLANRENKGKGLPELTIEADDGTYGTASI